MSEDQVQPVDISNIPTSGLKEYVINLAKKYNIAYMKTYSDEWSDAVTRLSDDDVVMDDVELLLLALERAGVIARADVVPLHVSYLREKFNARSEA
ncbi:MAG: hypothetical protein WC426_01755 [Sulfuriferula sp.]